MNQSVQRLDLLKPAERPFSEVAEQSHTLPASWYYDSEIYDQEKYAIFYKSWIYVGHVSQLVESGQYITAKIHDQSIFIIRADDSSLKAFYNVCQHRGHELLSGSGKTRVIVCPYHAWSYKNNGDLLSARNTETVPGFDRCDFALKSVQVEEFLGLVFVNCDPDAMPFSETVAGLKEEILNYVPEVESLTYAKRNTYDVAANWKVVIDNFLECYHCHTAHRDFVDLVNMPAYRSVTHPYYSSHCSDGPVNSGSSAYSVASDVNFSYAAWFIWPNVTIWIMPGEPNLSVLQMNPSGVETTGEVLDWYLTGNELSTEMQQASEYLDQVLQPEDIGLCESVQRGLKSIGYNQGRFVVDSNRSELSEHCVHHFQGLVRRALAE